MTDSEVIILQKAADLALKSHQQQVRKGSNVPYVSHVLQVSGLTLEFGGSIEQAAAALLHDVIEDCGVTFEEIDKLLGNEIASIVRECSDWEGSGVKASWKERKERYIEHISSCRWETLLVSVCDKLHNCRAIVRDVKNTEHVAWTRFKAKPSEIVWYYESLVDSFTENKKRLPDSKQAQFAEVLREFKGEVGELKELSTRLKS